MITASGAKACIHPPTACWPLGWLAGRSLIRQRLLWVLAHPAAPPRAPLTTNCRWLLWLRAPRLCGAIRRAAAALRRWWRGPRAKKKPKVEARGGGRGVGRYGEVWVQQAGGRPGPGAGAGATY
jgi:hypothetical protein